MLALDCDYCDVSESVDDKTLVCAKCGYNFSGIEYFEEFRNYYSG